VYIREYKVITRKRERERERAAVVDLVMRIYAPTVFSPAERN
jgi:hypothetical protein